jgi:ribosomal-protein-alanine N-acetyltransferase
MDEPKPVPTPSLQTPRLLIRPFLSSDISERYLAWLNDPETVRYSELRHARHDRVSCEAYLRSFEGTQDHYWAICAQDAALGHIGNIAAHLDLPNGRADVGILIGERGAWGRGFGSEAWSEVCRFLLGLPSIRMVTAGAMASNAAMVQLAVRSGMAEDARRLGFFLLDGKAEDAVFWHLESSRHATSNI